MDQRVTQTTEIAGRTVLVRASLADDARLGDLFFDATDGRGGRKAASLAVLPEFLPRLTRVASSCPSTREA